MLVPITCALFLTLPHTRIDHRIEKIGQQIDHRDDNCQQDNRGLDYWKVLLED